MISLYPQGQVFISRVHDNMFFTGSAVVVIKTHVDAVFLAKVTNKWIIVQ
jgi:hypothetical protein